MRWRVAKELTQGAAVNAPNIGQQVAQFAVRSRHGAWGRPVCRGARLLCRNSLRLCVVRSLRRAPLAGVPARRSLAAKERVSAHTTQARCTERPSTETDSLSVPVPCTRPTGSRDNAALQRVTPDQRRGVLRFLKRRRTSEQGYATAGCGLRTAAGGAAARAWSMQSASKARAPKPSRAPSRPATWLEQRLCQARVTTARP